MRRTTVLLTAVCLLAGGVVGCSKSDGEKADDCAAALSARTGGDSTDTPTVSEAEEQVDAFDKALADMVRSGYDGVAKDAFDTLEKKTKEGGESRPEECEPLSEDDYTALLAAKAIDGLGWTGEHGEFDKLKMVEDLGD
ncbi:hypothetical protein ACOT81_16570 [Streptomyces sp. WI04-05B]|uniref:hypothetical protein n=1 Tax=Streptomyces TaxID=1883 RepID=UPI0029AEF44A|nr:MULTISPECIES: hypothetical protein [unclassified Streptomyces]MDX2547167.1 hypothetical protein [Streptomyces sp. WI04-05B]MDX2581989.1 hypothetical protein [Streptomyces sp. WI04-05A]